jgi:hypothetical protein
VPVSDLGKEEDMNKRTAAIEEMVFDGFKKLSKKRKKEVVDFVSYLKAKEELEATKEIIKDKDFLESIMKGDEDFKIGHFKKRSDNNWFINTNDCSLTTND